MCCVHFPQRCLLTSSCVDCFVLGSSSCYLVGQISVIRRVLELDFAEQSRGNRTHNLRLDSSSDPVSPPLPLVQFILCEFLLSREREGLNLYHDKKSHSSPDQFRQEQTRVCPYQETFLRSSPPPLLPPQVRSSLQASRYLTASLHKGSGK